MREAPVTVPVKETVKVRPRVAVSGAVRMVGRAVLYESGA